MKLIFHSTLVCALLMLPGITSAQSCRVYCPDGSSALQDCNSNNDPCSSSSRSSNSGPGYDYGAAQRAQQAQQEQAAAEAERQRQQAEAERIERERRAEEKRQKDAAFIHDRDAAANSLKGSSGGAMNQLKGLSGLNDSGLKASVFDSSGGLKGLSDNDHMEQPARAQPIPHTDTSVVDARVPRDGAYLTNQVSELKNSPAADRIDKGFQAVIKHDWPVALAWWQDALNRDPNNIVLKRSVDLAQWMVDKRKAKAAGPPSPLAAAIYNASHGDSATAIRQFELAKAENPGSAAQIDDMINALRQRQAKDAKAAYWNREIKKQNQELVDGLFETGINRLSIGDEKGAQEAFSDATFLGGVSNVRPSQLPSPKSAKNK